VAITVLAGWAGAGSSSSSDSAFAIPSGYQAGDLALCCVGYSGGTGVGTVSVTSNGNGAAWTAVSTRKDVGTSYGMQLFYRILTAGDGTTATISLGVANKHSEEIFVFRGVDNTNPINQALGQANSASANITAPSVTTTVANTQIVCFFGTKVASTTAITLPGTLTADNGNGTQGTSGGSGNVSCREGSKSQAAAGSTGTFTATSSSADNVGWIIALAPEVAAVNTFPPEPERPRVLTNVLLRM
jgi:hypothetical protein